jgi:hypothetical protein
MESKPFELLKKLHAARHVAAISTLLGRQPRLQDMLSKKEKYLFDGILSDLEEWKSTERQHGVGAVLNLSDPTIRRLRGQLAYVKVIPAVFYENAERYQGAAAA